MLRFFINRKIKWRQVRFAVSVVSIILSLAFIIVSICASQNFNKGMA